MPIYRYDDSFRKEGISLIAGIDEAGRGPMAGPVVAAAVILPPHIRIAGLRDSKKVPEEERERIFFEILCYADDIGVGISDVETIEKCNILNATKKAMASAVDELDIRPEMLLIDAVDLPMIDIPQKFPLKGDALSASIAAASIVAKCVRDALMLHYHSLYPEYGFDRHKGYGTKEHIESIRLNGPCPLHRKSFRGVMSLNLPF